MNNDNLRVIKNLFAAAAVYVAACWFFELPSVAYDLIRWLALIGVSFSIWLNKELGNDLPQFMYFLAGGLVFIFNPFVPIYIYEKGSWFLPDLGLFLWFIFSYYSVEFALETRETTAQGGTAPPVGSDEFNSALADEEEKLRDEGDEERYKDIPF